MESTGVELHLKDWEDLTEKRMTVSMAWALILCQALGYVLYIHYVIDFLSRGRFVTPMLQIRKKRLRKIKWLSQGQTATKCLQENVTIMTYTVLHSWPLIDSSASSHNTHRPIQHTPTINEPISFIIECSHFELLFLSQTCLLCLQNLYVSSKFLKKLLLYKRSHL